MLRDLRLLSTFAVVLALVLPASAGARPATHSDLVLFSRELANESTTRSLEIGAGYIEEDSESAWAVVSWRSPDGRRRGQAVLFVMCGHWNLAMMAHGPVSAVTLLHLHVPSHIDRRMAERLASDSINLQRTAKKWLPPSRATPTC